MFRRFGQIQVYRAIWVFPDQRPNTKWMKESLARMLSSCPILAARASTEDLNNAVAVLDNSGSFPTPLTRADGCYAQDPYLKN